MTHWLTCGFYLLSLLYTPGGGEVSLVGGPTAGLSTSELPDLRLSRLGFEFQYHVLLP